jgi:hypothetical protein
MSGWREGGDGAGHADSVRIWRRDRCGGRAGGEVGGRG